MRELSNAQIEQFRDRGFLRSTSQLSDELCAKLREKVWQRLEKRGFVRHQPDTWIDAYADHSRMKQIRRTLSLNDIYTEEIRQQAYQLLDAPAHREERQLLLLTFPDSITGLQKPGGDFFPFAWHTDCPRVPNVAAPGVIVLTYLDQVVPGGGGTYIVAGSQRICTSPDRPIRSKQLKRYLRRFDLFKILFAKQPEASVDVRGMSEIVDGVTLEVVELAGRAGDVVFVDGRVLHAIAPNRTQHPRMMVRGFFSSVQLLKHYQVPREEVAIAS